MSIISSNLSNRLAKITLKNLKEGDGQQLRKIVDSFNHFVEKKDEQSLHSNFKIGHSKLNKQEKLTIKTDPVKSEKYPSLTTFLTRNKGENVENFANNGFSMGQEMGELLKAENRNVHLSPRRIYDKGQSVNQESLGRYKETLNALSQNELVLQNLSKSTEAKILKNGKFRIQKKGNEYIPSCSITLGKKSNQTQDEFINEAVQFAKLVDEYSPYVNPNIALNKNPFDTHILPNGLDKYKQATSAFKRNIEAQRKLKNIAGVHVDIESSNQIRITDRFGRQYTLTSCKKFDSEPERLIQEAIQFSENVALAGHNISPALMLKGPLSQTFSNDGCKKFDQAAAIFRRRSQEINDFKRHGVYIKLRHNNSFRVSRYVNNVQVFEKTLNPKPHESLEDLISRGFDCAELLKTAPISEHKNVFHKLGSLFQKRDSLPPLKPSPHVPVYPNLQEVTEQKIALERKSAEPVLAKAEPVQTEDLVKANTELPQTEDFVQTNAELPQQESPVNTPIQVKAEPVQLEGSVKNDTPEVLNEQIHSNYYKSQPYQIHKEEPLWNDIDIPWHLQEMKPRKPSPEQMAQRQQRQERQLHHSRTWRRLSTDEIAQKKTEKLHLKTTNFTEEISDNASDRNNNKQLASSATPSSASDESFQHESTNSTPNSLASQNSSARRLQKERNETNDKLDKLRESKSKYTVLPSPEDNKHFAFTKAKQNSNILGPQSVLSSKHYSGNPVVEINASKIKMKPNLKKHFGNLFKKKTQLSQ